MKTPPALGFLVIIACASLLLPGCGSADIVDQTEDGKVILMRSPQPDRAHLLAWHQDYGLKTVVNLRGTADEADWFSEEAQAIRDIGAKWIHLPISGQEPPPPDSVEEFFQTVENPENWPVLIHCSGGRHRTGVLVALYRIQFQGWSQESALEEMAARFDESEVDRSALKAFVRDFRPLPSFGIAGQNGAP